MSWLAWLGRCSLCCKSISSLLTLSSGWCKNKSCKGGARSDRKDTGPLRDRELRDNDPEFRGKGHLREQLCIVFSSVFSEQGRKCVQSQIICISKSKSQTELQTYFVLGEAGIVSIPPDTSVPPKGSCPIHLRTFQWCGSLFSLSPSYFPFQTGCVSVTSTQGSHWERSVLDNISSSNYKDSSFCPGWDVRQLCLLNLDVCIKWGQCKTEGTHFFSGPCPRAHLRALKENWFF